MNSKLSSPGLAIHICRMSRDTTRAGNPKGFLLHDAAEVAALRDFIAGETRKAFPGQYADKHEGDALREVIRLFNEKKPDSGFVVMNAPAWLIFIIQAGHEARLEGVFERIAHNESERRELAATAQRELSAGVSA
jgi:hypothetical protein